jgi:hypothetical protein
VLFGCKTISSDSELSTVIESSIVSSSAINTAVPDGYIQKWDTIDANWMQENLGEVLPLAPFSVNYESSFEEDGTGPYIFIYDETYPVIFSIYKPKLIEKGYTYLDSESGFDEEYDLYFYEFEKVVGTKTIFVELGEYLADADYPAAIYLAAWAVNEEEPGEVTGNIVLTPSLFLQTGYNDNNGAHVYNGLAFSTTSVMNQSNFIQFKKGEGVLFNTQPLAIVSITIAGLTTGQYTGTLSVYAGTSSSQLTLVTPSVNTYNLNGATYFKIANQSSYAAQMTSITIVPVL